MSDISNLPVFPHTIGNLDDRPNLPADEMKAKFEQDCMELWNKVREVIPDLNARLPMTDLVKVVNSSSTDGKVPTAKAVYNAIADALLGAGGEIAGAIISDWLDDHPEATTTVADGAITYAKLSSGIQASVPPLFDSSKAYYAGEYVFYDSTVYKFIKNHAAGAWSSSDVVAVPENRAIGALKGASGENLVVFMSHTSTTMSDVTYTWAVTGDMCKISGTSSALSVNTIFYNTSALPYGIKAGDKIYFDVDLPTHVRVEVTNYISGTGDSTVYIYSSQPYVVPASTGGLLIRFSIPSGKTVSGVARVGIFNTMPNRMLTDHAGSGIYQELKTPSRVNVIKRSVASGETILFWPIGWTGPTATKITLYGVASGVDTKIGETTVGNRLMETVSSAYDWLKVSITCEDLTTAATLSMFLAISDTDGVGDQMFSILSAIYGTDEIYRKYTTASRVFSSGISVSSGDTIFFKPLSWTGPLAEYYSLYVYENGDRVLVPGSRLTNLGESFVYTFDQDYDAVYVGVRCDDLEGSEDFTMIFVKTGVDGNSSQMFTVINDMFQASGGGSGEWASPLKNKYLSILGASTSTFQGYIPSGYSAYYPHEGASSGDAVTEVNDTYWKKVINALGMQLLVNNSSSGSFCTTGHGSDSMAGCGTRCETLDDGVHNPDIILVQLGSNDFTRSAPIGTYDGSQTFPSDTSYFRNAYAVMMKKITEKYKHARVFCMTLPMVSGGTYISQDFPPKNEDNILLESYNKAIREIASLFGCQVIELNRCGVTFQNTNRFDQDYSSVSNYGMHANRDGHSLYANEIIRALDPSCPNMYSY